MSTTVTVPGVTYLGCRSHFDPGSFNPGFKLDIPPNSVRECAEECASKSFNRLIISDQDCRCYVDINLPIAVQNIDECNRYCPDGPCGTSAFINRFSAYDITELTEKVQASITSSIQASITSSIRAKSSSAAAATAPPTLITSVAVTAFPSPSAKPTSLTPEIVKPNSSNGSTSSDQPFILQAGGILMLVALGILVVIGLFILARHIKNKRDQGKNPLPIFHVLPKRSSSESVTSMKSHSVFGGSTLGRLGPGASPVVASPANNSVPSTLDRSLGAPASPRDPPASEIGVPNWDNMSSTSSAGAGSLKSLTKKDDLVHQMFGLTSSSGSQGLESLAEKNRPPYQWFNPFTSFIHVSVTCALKLFLSMFF
ncbi:hypothetical protein HDU97_009012 [Phlyctochytrium planicorne]|nr:hypothetical protein HDU97_009012 [Phlyctochytrium planicorne]